MSKYDGTRFTKAATPGAGGALNVSNRIIGANPRKQKLTEAAGTNPTKVGGGGGGSLMKNKPGPKTFGGSGYAQDTAPHKSQNNEYSFGVGGPGFDQINLKGFK